MQVEQIPPPLLFMRTVLQAIGAFPSLVRTLNFPGNVVMFSIVYCGLESKNSTVS